MADLMSRPYQPNPDYCCEACVFGRGEHAEWCPVPIQNALTHGFAWELARDFLLLPHCRQVNVMRSLQIEPPAQAISPVADWTSCFAVVKTSGKMRELRRAIDANRDEIRESRQAA